MKERKDRIYCRYIKRILDIIFAPILGIPAAIIIFLCYIGIKCETKGPAFFVQQRPGKNGKIFSLYKLRTMIVATKHNGKLLSNMERITKIGRIIRNCSFDELPQLWNILKGDMSFIGPRPLRVEYLPCYSEFQAHRHDVKPGITGWAQVNGRNNISWEEKFELDVWYTKNVSLILDLRIIIMTILKVMKKDGINESENHTMKPFKGAKLDG